MTLKKLVTEMTHAVISGVSLQHSVRAVCEEVDITVEARANNIANAVTSFRSGIQTYVTAVEDQKDIRNKKVNNIINDVSRICKAELGYSIKCTSRKGGHVYEAQEYFKPIKISVPSSGGVHVPIYANPEIDDLKDEITKLKKSVKDRDEILKEWQEWQENHEGMIEWVILAEGREEAGRMMVEALKNAPEEEE